MFHRSYHKLYQGSVIITVVSSHGFTSSHQQLTLQLLYITLPQRQLAISLFHYQISCCTSLFTLYVTVPLSTSWFNYHHCQFTALLHHTNSSLFSYGTVHHSSTKPTNHHCSITKFHVAFRFSLFVTVPLSTSCFLSLFHYQHINSANTTALPNMVLLSTFPFINTLPQFRFTISLYRRFTWRLPLQYGIA